MNLRTYSKQKRKLLRDKRRRETLGVWHRKFVIWKRINEETVVFLGTVARKAEFKYYDEGSDVRRWEYKLPCEVGLDVMTDAGGP